MKRKIFAAILACVMLMAIAVPALAATPLEPALKIGSTTQVPTINIQMPTTAAIVLNPYKLSVKLDKLTSTAQVVSPVYSIANFSDVPLQASIQISATKAGAVTLDTGTTAIDPATENTATPKARVTFNASIEDSATTAPTGTAIALKDTAAYFTGFGDFAAATSPEDASTTNTMDKGTGTRAAAAAGYLNFQFAGEANNLNATWTAKDTVTPVVTFKFKIVPEMPS